MKKWLTKRWGRAKGAFPEPTEPVQRDFHPNWTPMGSQWLWALQRGETPISWIQRGFCFTLRRDQTILMPGFGRWCSNFNWKTYRFCQSCWYNGGMTKLIDWLFRRKL